MMKISKMLLLSLAALFLSSSQAFAYVEKTYLCENILGLPKNSYKIENLNVGPGGSSLPFVTIHRYHRAVPGDANSAVEESTIRGFAAVSTPDTTTAPTKQTLLIAAIRLDFTGDELFNCRE